MKNIISTIVTLVPTKEIVFSLFFFLICSTSLNNNAKYSSQVNPIRVIKNHFKTILNLRLTAGKTKIYDDFKISNPINPPEKSFFSDYKLEVDKGMSQEYWLALKSIDQKLSYQGTSINQHQMQSQLSNGFKDRILQNFIQTKLIDRPVKLVERNNEQVKVFTDKVQKITAQQSVEASIKQGGFDLKVGSRANVWGRSGKAWLQSDLVNLEASIGLQDSELYRVIANREIIINEKIPKIKSSVYYGGTSGNIGASVNSQIIKNVQWMVQSNFPKDNKSEHTFSINYGLSL